MKLNYFSAKEVDQVPPAQIGPRQTFMGKTSVGFVIFGMVACGLQVVAVGAASPIAIPYSGLFAASIAIAFAEALSVCSQAKGNVDGRG